MPEFGEKIRVWPAPGRRVQVGHRPVDFDGGGSFIPAEGREVVWTPFHGEQLNAGDLCLHDPAPSAAPARGRKAGG